MIRNMLAFAGLAVIVAACGNKPSLGSGDPDGGAASGGSSGSSGSGGTAAAAGGGGTGGATWDPCGGKPCGAECSVCPPNDPSCAETAVLKFCDSSGSCGSAYPVCQPQQCQDSGDCPDVGAPCEPCPDGSFACPGVDCIGGQCVFSGSSCQGQQCKDAGDCPAVGAPCQLCNDGSYACPWTDCVNGVCVGGFPGCPGFEPCDGKACGDPCTQCPPNDPGCAETSVLKFCDQNGSCQPNFPTCGGNNQCQSEKDCAVITVCIPCPGTPGGCAQPACVNGKCDLVCPPSPTPECKTSNECAQTEICKLCNDGSCASTVCIDGKCALACI